ncbi:NAD-dependent epimerase/dehydratase family protein [Bradyrhizobium sp. sGM-13]|uniref:NAD-dependent epimerase/dehydratase family protein n=1 Tax=Bradyrhizobium sp. sGM-13 TaxID=2831781 RepID=UPI00201C1975|nr:NAD-dependent epimerase/dehydratase family protein [Bradyrhizobium sp. sGM-13]
MNADIRKILVLGASGLIGRFVTDDLRGRGFRVVGVARRLSASQKNGALDLDHPGQMVRPAVPDQGADDRKSRAVLGRLRLHCAGDFL